jgi:hypothetical protein
MLGVGVSHICLVLLRVVGIVVLGMGLVRALSLFLFTVVL